MNESGEGPPIVELNPAQKQTQLRSVYAALPETSSIAQQKEPGHFTFDIPRTGITPEEQAARFPEDVQTFMKASVGNKELRKLKYEELNQLLEGAKIPQLLKDRIKGSFQGGFTFGITRKMEEKDSGSIYNIIGATPASDSTEGIFSLNDADRLAVVQDYINKLEGVVTLYQGYMDQSQKTGKTDRVQYYTDTITRIKSDIETLIAQSASLYGPGTAVK